MRPHASSAIAAATLGRLTTKIARSVAHRRPDRQSAARNSSPRSLYICLLTLARLSRRSTAHRRRSESRAPAATDSLRGALPRTRRPGAVPTDRALASPAPCTATHKENDHETGNSQPLAHRIDRRNRRVCTGRSRPGSPACADRRRTDSDISADDYFADGTFGKSAQAGSSAAEIAAPRLRCALTAGGAIPGRGQRVLMATVLDRGADVAVWLKRIAGTRPYRRRLLAGGNSRTFWERGSRLKRAQFRAVPPRWPRCRSFSSASWPRTRACRPYGRDR
jgi:hypothetical protein